MQSDQSKMLDILAQLRSEYVVDLAALLDGYEQTTLKLLQANGFDDSFEELRRKTHSIKGTSGTFGLPMIALICNQIEELMDSCPSQPSSKTTVMVNHFLKHIELMRSVQVGTSLGQEEFSDVEVRLKELKTVCAENSLNLK